MISYTLAQVQSQQQEVLNQATVEPVLLSERSRPSHVIMSIDTYNHLLQRLTELEDKVLGKAAETALSESQLVGSETFVERLKELANGET
jgi:PHD/YefM family antitoxin component YafN of YafNO toxin-antitoxin module